jgi:5-(carboxyamino)imidazole ribonucleotide synthase
VKIGILGGGQLGRMMALAGYPLGLKFRFFDPSPDAPAAQVGEHICAPYDDVAALNRFVDGLDVATYEFENVPVASATHVAQHVPFYPAPEALSTAQDRLIQKNWFKTLAIPTAPFAAAEDLAGLERAVTKVGLPAIVKTRRFGYDGKGQFHLRSRNEIDTAWQTLGGNATPDQKLPVIVEGFVPFERELSIIAARDLDGQTRCYPLAENHHLNGILRLTLAPAPDSSELQGEAERMITRVMETLNYTGVLTIELFQHEGKLLANEMATRVHNSGHWSIEGAQTSQFENHVRAICGFPLGKISTSGPSIAMSKSTAMLNLIGDIPTHEQIFAQSGVYLHLYGKTEKAPGRKLGHLTLRDENMKSLLDRVRLLAMLPGVDVGSHLARPMSRVR